MPLLISAHTEGATVHLGAAGEVDIASRAVLAAAIAEALANERADTVVIDLAEVTFMDCGGMSALIGGRRLAAQAGRALHVRGARGIPLIVLRITGVLDYLET